MKKLLLFDIDGTLLMSEGATRKAISRTFQELFRVSQSIDAINVIGATDRGIFKNAAILLLGRKLSGKELKGVEKCYLELLPGELAAARFHLKPGVKKLLPLLAARREILLGVETGNLETGAYMKLKRGHIMQYFKFGGFGSDSENRTEIIRKAIDRAEKLNKGPVEPEGIYVIGDSPNDIIAGREAGAVTIAVGTGLLPQETVLAAKPDHFLNDLTEIPAFLRCVNCET